MMGITPTPNANGRRAGAHSYGPAQPALDEPKSYAFFLDTSDGDVLSELRDLAHLKMALC